MGKKKSKSAKSSSTIKRTPRKEPYTSERLGKIVEHLRDQAQRIASLARAMEDAGIEEVVTDGHAMLVRGINHIDNFADNTTRAVREAKMSKLN